MDEREFPRTRWGVALDGGRPVAVVLEYRGLSPQHLFVMGEPEGIGGILRDVIRTRAGLPRHQAGQRARRWSSATSVEPPTDMVRMGVDRAAFRPALGAAVRLDAGDTRHLNRLYELGLTSWLPPESVAARRLLRRPRGTRLIAAAGTHVISPTYGLAAVGNVYTNRDYRGQGWPRSSPAP